MDISNGAQWKSGERTFTLRPERHFFRFTESHAATDKETGEVKLEVTDLGLLPGGAYVEIVRLLQASGMEYREP